MVDPLYGLTVSVIKGDSSAAYSFHAQLKQRSAELDLLIVLLKCSWKTIPLFVTNLDDIKSSFVSQRELLTTAIFYGADRDIDSLMFLARTESTLPIVKSAIKVLAYHPAAGATAISRFAAKKDLYQIHRDTINYLIYTASASGFELIRRKALLAALLIAKGCELRKTIAVKHDQHIAMKPPWWSYPKDSPEVDYCATVASNMVTPHMSREKILDLWEVLENEQPSGNYSRESEVWKRYLLEREISTDDLLVWQEYRKQMRALMELMID